MGDVYQEFEGELAAWKRLYHGRPREEMLRLLLLALEREQIVSVAYREALLRTRLAAMALDQEAHEVIRHALLCAWKDEEMHAVYVRGALIRLGDRWLRLRTYTQQAQGGIAGWATSVQHHVRFAQAPLSRALAGVLTAVGLVAGKIPRAVRAQLGYGSFRSFCLFNVDAERTAALCFSRLADLATGDPDLSKAFRHMREDEERHERIFALLAESLDEEDRLLPAPANALAARVAEIGEFFLPIRLRPPRDGEIGSGSKVVVQRGETAADKRSTLRRALEAAGLEPRLRERARRQGRSVESLSAAIKTNFMIGYHRKDLSPLTDPELVGELASVLRGLGVCDVAVLESPTIYDRFYANRSVEEVARYFGITSPDFRVVDTSREQVPHNYSRGMGPQSVSRAWRDADFRISFAKMRSNPVDVATLSVANLEGLGPRHDAYFFAERQAHRDTAMMMLLAEFPPHFALIDAYDSASDGLLGMMGNPRPKALRRIYAGGDAVSVDRVAIRHMGTEDPDRSRVLRAARHWFGDPPAHVDVVGIDEPIRGWRGPYASEVSTLLSLLAYPVYQFGSGRGSLFVPEMDEVAFPPLDPPGPLLRIGRRAVQTLFGLRHVQ